MPPHQRHMPQDSQMQPSNMRLQSQGQNIFSKINGDITALNSSILLLSQKMKYLIRNEKILGRNLLVINKKLKDVQELKSQGAGADTTAFERSLSDITARLDELSEKMAMVESEVDNIKQNYAKSEQVSEIKYVINSINPLEFATLKDVQEIVSNSKKKKEA